jgi:hypothetical protein
VLQFALRFINVQVTICSAFCYSNRIIVFLPKEADCCGTHLELLVIRHKSLLHRYMHTSIHALCISWIQNFDGDSMISNKQ